MARVFFVASLARVFFVDGLARVFFVDGLARVFFVDGLARVFFVDGLAWAMRVLDRTLMRVKNTFTTARRTTSTTNIARCDDSAASNQEVPRSEYVPLDKVAAGVLNQFDGVEMVKYKATQHPGVEIVGSEESNFTQACGLLGFEPAQIRQLQGCLADLLECAPRLRRCEPQLSRFEQCTPMIEKMPQICGRLEELVTTCNGYEKQMKNACCPGQDLYGPVTIDRYSSVTTVDIETIVTGLGDPYVDQYPVPTGKKIRQEQIARPGYCPEEIEVDLSLSNNATNYLTVRIQFYVGDEKIGPEYKGSHFLDKDGTIKKIKFPLYRDHVVVIGTAEKLAVEIEMTGPNSIEFASITTHVNAAGWYQVCAT